MKRLPAFIELNVRSKLSFLYLFSCIKELAISNQNKVLLISFDAVGAKELDTLRTLPNFRKLMDSGSLIDEVETIFVSNTYPIHTSIATGKLPSEHGIFANTALDPENPDPHWNYDSRLIRCKTLWQAARERGLRVAAILWPVTAYAKEIADNIPESRAQPGENQVLLNLRTGSRRTQLKTYFRHRHLLDGIKQPNLDRFTVASALDILHEKKPHLTMVHLTGYDAQCHEFGRGSDEAIEALHELDRNLGKLMHIAGQDTTVIVFSDHAQLNVHQALNPNQLLHDLGFLRLLNDGSVRNARAFFGNADGSAFLINRSLGPEEIANLSTQILRLPGVRRLLNPEELRSAGYPNAVFGIAADAGTCFSHELKHKATHGYPLDMPDYQVFYLISRKNIQPVSRTVLDITHLVANELHLSM